MNYFVFNKYFHVSYWFKLGYYLFTYEKCMYSFYTSHSDSTLHFDIDNYFLWILFGVQSLKLNPFSLIFEVDRQFFTHYTILWIGKYKFLQYLHNEMQKNLILFTFNVSKTVPVYEKMQNSEIIHEFNRYKIYYRRPGLLWKQRGYFGRQK